MRTAFLEWLRERLQPVAPRGPCDLRSWSCSDEAVATSPCLKSLLAVQPGTLSQSAAIFFSLHFLHGFGSGFILMCEPQPVHRKPGLCPCRLRRACCRADLSSVACLVFCDGGFPFFWFQGCSFLLAAASGRLPARSQSVLWRTSWFLAAATGRLLICCQVIARDTLLRRYQRRKPGLSWEEPAATWICTCMRQATSAQNTAMVLLTNDTHLPVMVVLKNSSTSANQLQTIA